MPKGKELRDALQVNSMTYSRGDRVSRKRFDLIFDLV